MYFLYNIAVYLAGFVLNLISLCNEKIKLFVKGRVHVFERLEVGFKPEDSVIWFHCASLGEFEQGRPVIEKIRNEFPYEKILVTFFSPSGYEIRKDYDKADLVTYLPLDTKSNVKNFLNVLNPKVAIFVKYEFWPNLLRELRIRNIHTILISGIFRENQPFFKWYGGWIRKALTSFDHFFVQDEKSKELLAKIGYQNVTVSGDTRFDRVYEVTKEKIDFELFKRFTENKITLVAGSTWPLDEKLLVAYINDHSKDDEKFIIAPHNTTTTGIKDLKKSINKKVLLLSKYDMENATSHQVLIIDSIGILSKIYTYGDIAYVGGGFGTGIHNILEPATFALPVVVGPNYHKFKEAKDLVKLGACSVISNKKEFFDELSYLFSSSDKRIKRGKLSRNYVEDNTGATEMINNYLLKIISKK